jgi:hypothetical protein
VDPGARQAVGRPRRLTGDTDMSTRDNGPVLEGWAVTGRCCGELHNTVACSVCLNDVKPDLPLVPPNCVLGDN